MSQKFRKAFLRSQVIISVLVILFGTGYALRCLMTAQWFYAGCYIFMAAVCGYTLMFRTALAELRQFNETHSKVNKI